MKTIYFLLLKTFYRFFYENILFGDNLIGNKLIKLEI